MVMNAWSRIGLPLLELIGYSNCMKVDPVFDEILRHPRFTEVERCVGLAS